MSAYADRDRNRTGHAQFVLLAVRELAEVDAGDLGADGGGIVRDLRRRGQEALLLGIRPVRDVRHRELREGLPLDVRPVRLQ